MARVLLIGAGDAGLKIAWGLADNPAVHHVTLADASVSKASCNADMMACCTDAVIDVRQFDGTDHRQMRGLLKAAKPDLIVQCASLIGPWATIGVEHPIATALSQAGLGVQMPVQLPILKTLMECRADLDITAPVANLSLPDMSHAVMATQGLAPMIGLGNVTIQMLRVRAALRREIANAGDDTADMPLLRLVGHHHNVYGVMQCREPDSPDDTVRVFVGEDALARPELAYQGEPVPPGPIYNVITAAASLEVLKGLLPDSAPIRISAPAPIGMLGGYPVIVSREEISLDLPDQVDLEDCKNFQKRMSAADGVAEIESDGTVNFTENARRTMAVIAPALTEPLRLKDLATRAELLKEVTDRIR